MRSTLSNDRFYCGRLYNYSFINASLAKGFGQSGQANPNNDHKPLFGKRASRPAASQSREILAGRDATADALHVEGRQGAVRRAVVTVLNRLFQG